MPSPGGGQVRSKVDKPEGDAFHVSSFAVGDVHPPLQERIAQHVYSSSSGAVAAVAVAAPHPDGNRNRANSGGSGVFRSILRDPPPNDDDDVDEDVDDEDDVSYYGQNYEDDEVDDGIRGREEQMTNDGMRQWTMGGDHRVVSTVSSHVPPRITPIPPPDVGVSSSSPPPPGATGDDVRMTFDLCGSMWKRRGGLGRNAEHNWVIRYFTLKGPRLCYYHEGSEFDSSINPANITTTKPRASLDLSKVETIAEMHSKAKRGLPSQDLLTINIYDPIVHAKRKWEMCCTSREQQLLWYGAIRAYDGKPTAHDGKPVTSALENNYNAHFSHEGGGMGLTTATSVPWRPSNDDHPLRQFERSAAALTHDDDVDLIARAAARAAEILIERGVGSSDGGSIASSSSGGAMTMASTITILNLVICISRYGSEWAYVMTVLVVNAYTLFVAYYGQNTSTKKASSSRTAGGGAKARAAFKNTREPTDAEAEEERQYSTTAQQQQEQQPRKSFSKVIPVGRTIPRALPARDGELERRLRSCAPNSAETVRAYAALTSPTDVEATPHSYGNADASSFQLRIGPNYKKNKLKGPSGPALYDLLSMDFLLANAPLRNVADKFQLPCIPGVTDISTGHMHIPPMLVINTWLPGEEPSMFARAADGGDTYSIPMIFVLSSSTLEQLRDIDNASPGVRLLSEWCCKAEDDPDFRGRFKCMGMIENIESSGVPKFIQGYNGKPALVTKSGTFSRRDNYIEFTINVNMWAFLAKKGLFALIPTFPDFVFNVGFTIEARNDEEMPEVLLGGCRLMNLDPDKVIVDGVDDLDICIASST